jgi:hypothetical protein
MKSAAEDRGQAWDRAAAIANRPAKADFCGIVPQIFEN